MPQAAQPIYCTINDAAVPVLFPLARISGHPNAKIRSDLESHSVDHTLCAPVFWILMLGARSHSGMNEPITPITTNNPPSTMITTFAVLYLSFFQSVFGAAKRSLTRCAAC